MGIELIGVDYFPAGKRSRVVVYIDKPGGFFIEDCEEVNKSLGKNSGSWRPHPLKLYTGGLFRE